MLNLLAFLFLIYLIAANNISIFAVVYSFTALALIGQLWLSKNGLNIKISFSVAYMVILILQQVFIALVLFSGIQTGIVFFAKKIAAAILIIVPFFIFYLNYLYSLQNRFFPSLEDASEVSFEIIKKIQNRTIEFKDILIKSKNSLCIDNLSEIAKDIPRHSYSKYLNKNTLTSEFFEECEKSLEDEHLYIVISSTGSPASELISVFTQKIFNHVSLSFDSELKTIISYNGGENVYPPGLNKEQLESFHKKHDASIMVYRIAAPKNKKKLVIEKIKEINEKGSAYNLVGLITKVSFRPNIMFCSQFVYSILKIAGLEYFSSTATNVKPTDLVEKDYYRKLDFCYEIKFNEL